MGILKGVCCSKWPAYFFTFHTVCNWLSFRPELWQIYGKSLFGCFSKWVVEPQFWNGTKKSHCFSHNCLNLPNSHNMESLQRTLTYDLMLFKSYNCKRPFFSNTKALIKCIQCDEWPHLNLKLLKNISSWKIEYSMREK